jgi:hypothetical protein
MSFLWGYPLRHIRILFAVLNVLNFFLIASGSAGAVPFGKASLPV